MIKINKENIINEDNPIEDFSVNKRIYISGIELCICKIEAQYKIDGEYKLKKGTGFFCNIQDKNLKVLMTNNHVLNQEFLDNAKKINYSIEENYMKKDYELNLEKKRYKYTDQELDFTVIEILKEDKISKFLEIDEFIYSKDYIEEKIVVIQYPLSQNLKISSGKIIKKEDNCFLYDVGTDGGSSGSPLILLDNLKIIGLHKGGYYSGDKKEKKYKINIGAPLNLIINKINYSKKDNNFSFKGFFNIFKSGNNTEKEKQITNNENDNDKDSELIKDFFKFEKIEEIDDGFNEEEKKQAKQNRFILIGAIASGKTTLVNVLFGKEVGIAKRDHSNVVTKEPRIYYYKYHGQFISIVDTPGFPLDYDKIIYEENILKLILNLFKEGIQLKGILFLMNFQFRKIDFEHLFILKKLCPIRDFWKHLLIIFTHYFNNYDDSLEEIKAQKNFYCGRVFESFISRDKESSDIRDYKEIRKIYLNSYWPLSNNEDIKRKQEKGNIENRKELEKVLEKMIFYDYIINKVEILQISYFKESENEKTYLINLVKIRFFDSLHIPLKEINHIISKREINPKEFKEDNFKQNAIEIVLNLNKNFDGIYIERKEKENCLII